LDAEAAEYPSEPAIRAHLAEILASPPFEASKRSREMLIYVIEKTLSGQTNDLKERSIGEDVFGRAGYEPSQQNLVRVSANELRKRLAQYYEQQPDSPVRIKLPRGAYVPAFQLQSQPLNGVQTAAAAPPEEPAQLPAAPTARLYAWPPGKWMPPMAILAAALALGAWFWRPGPSPEEAFWKPVLAAGKPAVIWAQGWGAVMPAETRARILPHDHDVEPYALQLRPDDLIVVDQIIAYGHVYGIATLCSWLAAHGQTPQLRLGLWNTPADLRDRPLILFGALNNPWTIDLTKDLRFRVETGPPGGVITDKTDPNRRWSIPNYRKRGFDIPMDYALLTRTIDADSGQVRIAIAGLAHYSSQAAAEFLTGPKFWSNMSRIAPRGWERMNLQVVLQVKVTEKVPGSPKPVAWHFW
jgi:hypothetical protein